MLKHTSLIVAGALVLGMGISTASFAEMPSLDSQSYTWPGSTINTSSDTDKIAPDPKTGKRPASLTGRAWVPMCRGIPTSPAMIPRTAASASSPFRGKMPSSGKVPRVPSVVTGHPQGGGAEDPPHLRTGRRQGISGSVQEESFFLPANGA